MLPIGQRKNGFLFSWLVLFASFVWLFQLSQSMHLLVLGSLFSIAFVAYLFLVCSAHEFSTRSIWFGTILLYLLAFWQMPFLSNDYYRFLWDGELMHLGINPYDFTPNQIIQFQKFTDCNFLDLYAGMGDLSRRNYSCYPTVNQAYFYLSTLFSNDIATNVAIMRALVFASMLFGAYHLNSILIFLNFSAKRIFLLLLNPLVIIESMGNLHFELVTVAFLLASLHLLLKQKFWLSALFFAFAVHVKLIPLLLLPFLLSYLGWKQALRYYLFVGFFVVLLFLPLLNFENLPNFVMSLRLYFREFEFNSYLLYPYLQYGQWKFGYNLTSLYAPKLARWALVIILGIAWNRKQIGHLDLLKRMFLGTMVYYFLTSTVHPWYWILPLALSVFTFSWSVLLASWCAIFSYGIYELGHHSDFRDYLAAMNVVVMIIFFLEIVQPKKWKERLPKVFRVGN